MTVACFLRETGFFYLHEKGSRHWTKGMMFELILPRVLVERLNSYGELTT